MSLSGKPLPGFPVVTGYRIYGGVCLADLDGDHVLDVIVGSGDKKLYAVNGRGEALPGFPVSLGDRIVTSCAVGDADRDGKPEIFVVTQKGKLLRVSERGQKSSVRVNGRLMAAPALADLDRDGRPEVVVGAKDGSIHALEITARGRAEVAILDWPMTGHDPAHSGRYGPNPARFKDLRFSKKEPLTTDAIEAKYTFFDLDGDSERDTQIRWFLGGKHVAELDNNRAVPARDTVKHQRWHYTVQEGANRTAYGEKGVLSRVFRSETIRVQNTRPAAPKINLAPAAPRTDAALDVTVTAPSTDADGDSIQYRYAWLRDGKPVELEASQPIVASKMTRKDQEWRVVVVPFDGEEEGAPATATVKIVNTPPGKPSIALKPAAPRIVDEITVQITKRSPDADGDTVTYSYRYWVDGKPFNLPLATGKIPSGVLRKHQKVRVEVTAIDDEEAGGRVDTTFEVANTRPPTPRITIWPSHPKTMDDLVLGVVGEERDADADDVTLRHLWLVDGKPVEHPLVVPHAQTKRGQRWQLRVTPFDGEATGKMVAVETKIENTAPRPPVVTLDRYTLFTDAIVAPKIAKAAHDDDGDDVTLKYRWKRNGRSARLPDSQSFLTPADTRKGETWELSVVPNDGLADGEPYTLALRIINSPPTAPHIALSTSQPTTRDAVTVEVTTPSIDKDGDRLSYRYRWFRNGAPMTAWKDSKSRLDPGEARQGEAWRVEVRADDGETVGEPATAELRVRNHAPSAPAVAIRAGRARTSDELICERTRPGTDPDGDELHYRTRWLVDGATVPIFRDVVELPSARTRKGQSWVCEMTSFDGELTSKPARSAPVKIGNTLPRPPRVSIVPKAPTTDADLTCQLDEPSSDADLDLVHYRFKWTVNGKPWRGTGAATPGVVPAVATRRGQTWGCSVIPNDGVADGRAAKARVEIRNSAPTSPRVRISPERPRAGQELRCEIVEASNDIDNDRIRYRYTWMKDGVKQPFAPASTAVPGRLVKANDMWKCQVTPSDTASSGSASASPDVVVSSARR